MSKKSAAVINKIVAKEKSDALVRKMCYGATLVEGCDHHTNNYHANDHFLGNTVSEIFRKRL